MKEGRGRRWRRGGGGINFDNKQHTCTQHYRVRDCNVNLPDGPSCILGIPECGRVWIHTVRQGLDTHIVSHLQSRGGGCIAQPVTDM